MTNKRFGRIYFIMIPLFTTFTIHRIRCNGLTINKILPVYKERQIAINTDQPVRSSGYLLFALRTGSFFFDCLINPVMCFFNCLPCSFFLSAPVYKPVAEKKMAYSGLLVYIFAPDCRCAILYCEVFLYFV